MSRELIIN